MWWVRRKARLLIILWGDGGMITRQKCGIHRGRWESFRVVSQYCRDKSCCRLKGEALQGRKEQSGPGKSVILFALFIWVDPITQLWNPWIYFESFSLKSGVWKCYGFFPSQEMIAEKKPKYTPKEFFFYFTFLAHLATFVIDSNSAARSKSRVTA